MKVEYKEFPEIKCYGKKIQCDIKKMNEYDFKGLWDSVMSISESDYYYGYEDYSNMHSEGVFDYYALIPGENKDFEEVLIPAGKFMVFENKLSTHGPGFFKKCYEYISANNIFVDYSFDMEVIPAFLNKGKKDSIVYVAFKMREYTE